MGFLPGGGGGVHHMVLFPPGEVLLWDFFRGGGGGSPYGIIPPWGSSAMGFLPGEGLPYGIPSSGKFVIMV